MIQLFNEDNLKVMATMPDNSIDVICIDPPYLYLKNQKLERPFDERLFFSECARLLKDKGFIVMFGRGESFYRWNSLIDSIHLKDGKYVFTSKQITSDSEGFVSEKIFHDSKDITSNKSYKKIMAFKEEIVWDKGLASQLNAVMRVHETCVLISKLNGKINRVKIPYLEARENNINALIKDVKIVKRGLGNDEIFTKMLDFIITKKQEYDRQGKRRNNMQGNANQSNRNVDALSTMIKGMNEKTIISEPRDAYFTSIHPTQKPVRLLERLLKLVIPMSDEKKLVDRKSVV